MKEHGNGLTGAQLKYLACVSMVIDHVGMLFAPMAAVAGADDLLYHLFRYAGRLAFPIFAFFVAEGCLHTHDFRRYLLRLGLFGALTHVVALIATGGQSGSVIATFFFAALGIWFYRLLRERGLHPFFALLPAAALVLLGQLFHVDYGGAGVAAVVALFLCGPRLDRRLLCLGLATAATYLVHFPLELALTDRIWENVSSYLPWFTGFYLPYQLLCLLCSWAALPLLARYNGRPGRSGKWFFYWFYPVHMAVLYLLSLLIS